MEINTVEDLNAVLAASDRKLEEKTNRAVEGVRQELAQAEYAREYMKANPEYAEAFKRGDLDEWISQGRSGESAYTEYQLRRAAAEKESLKKEHEELLKAKASAAATSSVSGDERLDRAMAIVQELQTQKNGEQGRGPRTSRAEQIAKGVEIVNSLRGR